MKKKNLLLFLSAATAVLVAGCQTAPHDQGPYVPQESQAPDYESTEPVVLLDSAVQYSVTAPMYVARTLDDGRLEVTVSLRNREARRIEVQANCVFKDADGVSTGDETPFQTVILSENATEQIKFVSANDQAKRYTVRVRQAH